MPGGFGNALKMSRGLIGIGFAFASRNFLKSTIQSASCLSVMRAHGQSDRKESG
jgi:hypothetical protein